MFEDTPRMGEVRARLDPDHIAYLRAHSDEIVPAGIFAILRVAPASEGCGSSTSRRANVRFN
jgi:hypothetical protein